MAAAVSNGSTPSLLRVLSASASTSPSSSSPAGCTFQADVRLLGGRVGADRTDQVPGFEPRTSLGGESDGPFLPWSNPDNVISYDAMLAVQHVLCCYVNNVFLLVGVPGNALSCVVFFTQGLRDRMNLCLFCLACVDLVFVALMCLPGLACLATATTFTSASSSADVPAGDRWWWWWIATLSLYMTGLYRVMIFASGCLTMFIAVDRCLCVCLPMHAPALLKTRSMAAIIGCTLVALQLLCLPYPFKNKVSATWDPASNRTYFGLTDSAAYAQHRAVFDVLINVFDMSLIPFTTFAVVSVATSLTVVKLRRAIAWRGGSQTNGPHSRRQVALVKMLVVVCCIYMATAAPNVALGITRCLVHDFATAGRYSNVYLLASALTFELAMVNSSVSFFVYVTQSSRFREELLRYVACGKAKKRKQPPKSR